MTSILQCLQINHPVSYWSCLLSFKALRAIAAWGLSTATCLNKQAGLQRHIKVESSRYHHCLITKMSQMEKGNQTLNLSEYRIYQKNNKRTTLNNLFFPRGEHALLGFVFLITLNWECFRSLKGTGCNTSDLCHIAWSWSNWQETVPENLPSPLSISLSPSLALPFPPSVPHSFSSCLEIYSVVFSHTSLAKTTGCS